MCGWHTHTSGFQTMEHFIEDLNEDDIAEVEERMNAAITPTWNDGGTSM